MVFPKITGDTKVFHSGGGHGGALPPHIFRFFFQTLPPIKIDALPMGHPLLKMKRETCHEMIPRKITINNNLKSG